jgi:hypothetical protein
MRGESAQIRAAFSYHKIIQILGKKCIYFVQQNRPKQEEIRLDSIAQRE